MSSGPQVLRDASLPGVPGRVDVLLGDGRIAGVRESRSQPVADADALDLSGYLLLPSPVEAHAHLDKALLAERATSPARDLAGAIAGYDALGPTLTPEDIRDRALRALSTAVRRGCTLVRSHVNIQPGIGLLAVETLVAVAAEVAPDIELQIVGLVGGTITGDEGRAGRSLLAAAVDAGIDVLGGAPWRDPQPSQAIALLVDAAADAQMGIDLHLDETLDPECSHLPLFAKQVERRGLGGRAVASHCVSLGQQPSDVVRSTAHALADAGVAVVALPQTNLLLQGRELDTEVPRGLAPVRALRSAGVRVAGGSDNWRDMFNPLGRIDPFETAALLVAGAQIEPAAAYDCVSTEARMVLTGQPGGIRPGAPADLLAVRANSLPEAVAAAPEERIVLRGGRIIARTQLDVSVATTWSSADEPDARRR